MNIAMSTVPPLRLIQLHQRELSRHVIQCAALRGRWFGISAWAERIHGVLAPRFVTTVTAAAICVGILCLWI